MKSADIANVVRLYAEALQPVRGADGAQPLHALARVLDGFGSAPLATALKRVAPSIVPTQLDEPNLELLATSLSPLHRLLAPVAKAAAKDVANVIALLQTFPTASLSDLSRAVAMPTKPRRTVRPKAATGIRQDVISAYQGTLDSAVSDPQAFGLVYAEISRPQTLTPKEVVALAKAFSGSSARSRPDALKKIWNVHQELMVTRAKRLATGGRTAA